MNHKTIKNVLTRINANAPKSPLKGKGYIRSEVSGAVYELLHKHAPAHCVEISERSPINRFGKLGFKPSFHISPELFAKYGKHKYEIDMVAHALQIVNTSELSK
jgi:phosphoribosylaminoimidazole-succinocarboxamide synthase